MNTIRKLFVLEASADLFLKSGFRPLAEAVADADAYELVEEKIRWIVREFRPRWHREKIGTCLMVSIAIQDPSLAGTANPLEWPCPFGGYLGPSGVTEDTSERRIVFDASDVSFARGQVERVLLPWVIDVANMEWLRMLYEKRVEELKPRHALLGLFSRQVKERPAWHYYLSLLRWHCGDKQGAVEQGKRYLDLLPEDKYGAPRWYDWLKQASKE